MKERPILFSGPMVRSLLAGTKTQTRRAVKFPKWADASEDLEFSSDDGLPAALCGETGCYSDLICPYGVPGELLWVREAWRTAKCLDELSPAEIGNKCVEAGYTRPWAPLRFEADGVESNWSGFGSTEKREQPGRYRNSQFMPRWCSRITLRITDVRAQRLQEISEADAIAEGCPAVSVYDLDCDSVAPSKHYRDLWESINGAGSWAENPWVWALSFEVVL